MVLVQTLLQTLQNLIALEPKLLNLKFRSALFVCVLDSVENRFLVHDRLCAGVRSLGWNKLILSNGMFDNVVDLATIHSAP